MNIIIPIGGLGQRFKNEGYLRPKPLINILGKPILFYLLDNLKLTPEDQIYIIYKTDLDQQQFSAILHKNYQNIVLCPISYDTKGAAETVLYGLENMELDLTKKTVILDCDNFYTTDILSKFREMSCSAIFCFEDRQEKAIYSYVKIQEDQTITDIREKEKISNYANTGCYGFISAAVLKQYCQYVMEKNITSKGEYYLSCVVKAMLQDKIEFQMNLISLSDYHCLGTPLQVKFFVNTYKTKTEQKRFCFDLDGTLVTHPTLNGDYSTVLPIQQNINLVNYLYHQGHYIIIYTARRMRTHQGNLGQVIKDIGMVTQETLKKYNIQHHELIFGKPYADFYIDDLAVNHLTTDLGKELGFYTTQIAPRSFNSIQSGTHLETIIKRSTNKGSLEGEVYWYNHIPSSVRHLFPVFIRSGEDFYEIEKINGINLSKLFISQSLTPQIFRQYLAAIGQIHQSTSSIEVSELDICANYTAKINRRQREYSEIYQNYTELVKQITSRLAEYERGSKAKNIGVIHGDPVFSNCILDRYNNFKFIDMRGKLGDQLSIFGDTNYDYAKIYQSLIGYDEILNDQPVPASYKEELLKIFKKHIADEERMEEIKLITNSLLISLLPLHIDRSKRDRYAKLIN